MLIPASDRSRAGGYPVHHGLAERLGACQALGVALTPAFGLSPGSELVSAEPCVTESETIPPSEWDWLVPSEWLCMVPSECDCMVPSEWDCILPSECAEPTERPAPATRCGTGSTRWSRPGCHRYSSLRSIRSPHRPGRRPPSRQGKPPLRPRLVLWLVPVEFDTPTELSRTAIAYRLCSIRRYPNCFSRWYPNCFFRSCQCCFFPTNRSRSCLRVGDALRFGVRLADVWLLPQVCWVDCDCPWDVPRRRPGIRTGFARPQPSGDPRLKPILIEPFRREATEEVISATG